MIDCGGVLLSVERLFLAWSYHCFYKHIVLQRTIGTSYSSDDGDSDGPVPGLVDSSDDDGRC